MSITLRQPYTGEIKVLQEGWSWGCFFGSFFLGAPLYRRGLQVWGSAMVAFNLVTLFVGFVSTDAGATLYTWLTFIGFGLSIFFGLRANQMALDRYVSLGWEITDPRRRFR